MALVPGAGLEALARVPGLPGFGALALLLARAPQLLLLRLEGRAQLGLLAGDARHLVPELLLLAPARGLFFQRPLLRPRLLQLPPLRRQFHLHLEPPRVGPGVEVVARGRRVVEGLAAVDARMEVRPVRPRAPAGRARVVPGAAACRGAEESALVPRARRGVIVC